MVEVKPILGRVHYYRCTADGRIQLSEDCKSWRVVPAYRGKRVDMSKESITTVEAKIAERLDDPDRNYWAVVTQGR